MPENDARVSSEKPEEYHKIGESCCSLRVRFACCRLRRALRLLTADKWRTYKANVFKGSRLLSARVDLRCMREIVFS
jgi:hypothetical protein